MSIAYDKLANESRLLIEAELEPIQGTRFQPTGFADLGAARYTAPRRPKGWKDGDDPDAWEPVEMLLVESAQSVANRMEWACWDEPANDLIAELKGLPYIRVNRADRPSLTNSVLEAHRINSEYIMGSAFKGTLTTEIGYAPDSPIDWRKFRAALLKYDANSLIHGTFLEEIAGRLRVTRALSGFIEATNVRIAESGGVKNNLVQPELKGGAGNVPYHRTEFTAAEIKAFFNLDLALLRGYGLGDDATRLLVALALFKIRRFLSTGLRLRTACDLQVKGDLKVTRPPEGFSVPPELELLSECKRHIGRCAEVGLFAKPPITDVQWGDEKPAGAGRSGK